MGAQVHDLTDGSPEVLGRTQRPLDPGAGHLEGVAAGDRVVVVELTRHDPRGQGDGVEVDAAGLVDTDAQHAAGVLDVVDLEPEIVEQRGHGGTDAVSHGHVRTPPLALDLDLLRRKAWAPPTPPRYHYELRLKYCSGGQSMRRLVGAV